MLIKTIKVEYPPLKTKKKKSILSIYPLPMSVDMELPSNLARLPDDNLIFGSMELTSILSNIFNDTAIPNNPNSEADDLGNVSVVCGYFYFFSFFFFSYF